jgi:hypothetical protein
MSRIREQGIAADRLPRQQEGQLYNVFPTSIQIRNMTSLETRL